MEFTKCHLLLCAGLSVCGTTSCTAGKKQYSANICSDTKCEDSVRGKQDVPSISISVFIYLVEHTFCSYCLIFHVYIHSCVSFQQLSKMIPKSEVGVLTNNSDNVVGLIKNAYNVSSPLESFASFILLCMHIYFLLIIF